MAVNWRTRATFLCGNKKRGINDWLIHLLFPTFPIDFLTRPWSIIALALDKSMTFPLFHLRQHGHLLDSRCLVYPTQLAVQSLIWVQNIRTFSITYEFIFQNILKLELLFVQSDCLRPFLLVVSGHLDFLARFRIQNVSSRKWCLCLSEITLTFHFQSMDLIRPNLLASSLPPSKCSFFADQA